MARRDGKGMLRPKLSGSSLAGGRGRARRAVELNAYSNDGNFLGASAAALERQSFLYGGREARADAGAGAKPDAERPPTGRSDGDGEGGGAAAVRIDFAPPVVEPPPPQEAPAAEPRAVARRAPAPKAAAAEGRST